jgi:hypothetical protein
VCGFAHLSNEHKLKRAHEILNDYKLKQDICNYILGASFKDVDKAMRSIIADRNPPDDLDDMENVEYKSFTKNDIGVSDLPVTKTSKYKVLSEEETRALIAKGNAPVVEPPHKVTRYYETYSQEQVEQWVKDYLIDKEKQDGYERRRQNKGKESHD